MLLLQCLLFISISYLLVLSIKNRRQLKKSFEVFDIIQKMEYRSVTKVADLTHCSSGNHWIVIINYQRMDILNEALSSIKKHEPSIKILVVDNGSDELNTTNLIKKMQSGQIDKLVCNQNHDIPQWQKSFSIHQAINLLRVEEVASVSIMDNDVIVKKPWLQCSGEILLNNKDIVLVNLYRDKKQDHVHPPLSKIENVENAVLKESFNGAFFMVYMSFFKEYGLPPINEGMGKASFEDWYFSRLINQDNKLTACLDCSITASTASIRKSL